MRFRISVVILSVLAVLVLAAAAFGGKPAPVFFFAHRENAAPPAETGDRAREEEGKINLNLATEEDFLALPDFPLSLARDIVTAVRRQPLHFLEDVKIFRGVGDKRFRQIERVFFIPQGAD